MAVYNLIVGRRRIDVIDAAPWLAEKLHEVVFYCFSFSAYVIFRQSLDISVCNEFNISGPGC